jgi:hypothetical protein
MECQTARKPSDLWRDLIIDAQPVFRPLVYQTIPTVAYPITRLKIFIKIISTRGSQVCNRLNALVIFYEHPIPPFALHRFFIHLKRTADILSLIK